MADKLSPLYRYLALPSLRPRKETRIRRPSQHLLRMDEDHRFHPRHRFLPGHRDAALACSAAVVLLLEAQSC